jgi:hypothetical protein
MKRNQMKGLVTLALALTMVNLNAAELLGRISDETEATKAAVAVKGDSKLIYRVICSPDDEEPTLDCEKPPVEDAFNPVLVDEMPQMPDEQQAQGEKVVPVSKIDEAVVNQERAEASVEKHEHHHKKKHKADKGKKAKNK